MSDNKEFLPTIEETSAGTGALLRAPQSPPRSPSWPSLRSPLVLTTGPPSFPTSLLAASGLLPSSPSLPSAAYGGSLSLFAHSDASSLLPWDQMSLTDPLEPTDIESSLLPWDQGSPPACKQGAKPVIEIKASARAAAPTQLIATALMQLHNFESTIRGCVALHTDFRQFKYIMQDQRGPAFATQTYHDKVGLAALGLPPTCRSVQVALKESLCADDTALAPALDQLFVECNLGFACLRHSFKWRIALIIKLTGVGPSVYGVINLGCPSLPDPERPHASQFNSLFKSLLAAKDNPFSVQWVHLERKGRNLPGYEGSLCMIPASMVSVSLKVAEGSRRVTVVITTTRVHTGFFDRPAGFR